MIEVSNLRKGFGELEVLRGITEKIDDGEVVCIIGPSGSGKSTFLRCLNRLETPTSGEIRLDGELVLEENINSVRKKMGMVFQNFNLFPHMTSVKNVMIAPVKVNGESEEKARKHALELLTITKLSGGFRLIPVNQDRSFQCHLSCVY